MIAPKELRIGNYLYESGRLAWVAKIQRDRFSVYTNEGRRNSTLCEPIPLTPEILEKCGFKKKEDYWVYNGFKIWGDIIDDKFLGYLINNELLVHFDYVHQLQNIYYVLDNEELTINL